MDSASLTAASTPSAGRRVRSRSRTSAPRAARRAVPTRRSAPERVRTSDLRSVVTPWGWLQLAEWPPVLAELLLADELIRRAAQPDAEGAALVDLGPGHAFTSN